MTSSLVDSNILIDLLEDRSPFADWSQNQLSRLADGGDLVINQIVYAETASYFDDHTVFESTVKLLRLTLEDLPWPASLQAGKSHVAYRRCGGPRDRVLPDFLIGAHAYAKGYQLLTRDARRYRNYFPELQIVAPDTHP